MILQNVRRQQRRSLTRSKPAPTSFINIAPIVGGTNGISPIFLTTVGVTGGIGLISRTAKLDANGEPVLDDEGDAVLEQKFSIDTGTVLTINTKTKKLYNEDGTEELCDIASALLHRSSSSFVPKAPTRLSWQETQTTAAGILGIPVPPVYATSKEISHEGQGLAVEKIFNKNAVGTTPGKVLHAGSDVRVQVNTVTHKTPPV